MEGTNFFSENLIKEVVDRITEESQGSGDSAQFDTAITFEELEEILLSEITIIEPEEGAEAVVS